MVYENKNKTEKDNEKKSIWGKFCSGIKNVAYEVPTDIYKLFYWSTCGLTLLIFLFFLNRIEWNQGLITVLKCIALIVTVFKKI